MKNKKLFLGTVLVLLVSMLLGVNVNSASAKEHGIQSGVEFVIHERHLELALEIRNGPQALDDNGAALFARKVGQQLVGVHDRDVRNVRRDAADKLSALLRREHGAFFTVIHHADDQPVKAARRTGDDVEMTV